MTSTSQNIRARHKRTYNAISPSAYLSGRVRYDPLNDLPVHAIRSLVLLSSLKSNSTILKVLLNLV